MKKESSLSYSKNIFLDVDRMNELHSILLKYCDTLDIQAKTINKSSIDFDSYDELMSYSNFKTERIKQLSIRGYGSNKWDAKIRLTFSLEYPTVSTVDCDYSFEDVDEEIVFRKTFLDFLEKAKSSYIPSRIGDWLILFLIFAGAGIFLKSIFPSVSLSMYLLIYVVAPIPYKLCSTMWYKLFPIVSFSWGEATKYYDRLKKIRGNLFWGVIIAIAAGVIGNIIYNQLIS